MSQKKSGNAQRRADSAVTGRGKPKVEWKGYVNVTVDSSIKAGISKIEDMGLFVDRCFEQLREAGYDVKIGYDNYNQCYRASLYCQNPDDPNAGWCLSLRGDNWWTALTRLFFMHFTVYEGVWQAEGLAGWTNDQW